LVVAYDCVVDASVGIQVFVIEPLTDRATELFTYLAGENPAKFHVPDLFYIECANILWKYVSHHGYQYKAAVQDLADILDLPLHSTPTVDLAAEALQPGAGFKIAAYDATYVALAQRLELPLVTADERLVRRLQHTSIDVRWLGVWP
jgi:predicted nucleic acid-binding protein